MRCRMSGRFTPAAATLIRISFGFGVGTGRSAGVSTSGPPGLAISTARIFWGRVMRRILAREARRGPGEIDVPAGEHDTDAQALRLYFLLEQRRRRERTGRLD